MNFLAHLYLSGKEQELMTGNMLADFLKGNSRQNELPDGIKKGVDMHRAIDSFTDEHPVVEQTKKKLRPVFGHYSPVVADIFYDHFLAANWDRYSDESLKSFSRFCYGVLRQNKQYFPKRLNRFLFFMRLHNLFEAYASIHGLNRVFTGMSGRTRNAGLFYNATDELLHNYESYEADFHSFFVEMMAYAEKLRQKYVLEEKK